MKRNAKRILCLLLIACMLIGMLPVLALNIVAEEPAAKDYDSANDGDLLYTVDFSGSDGEFVRYTEAGRLSTNVDQEKLLSADGKTVTFAGKTTAAGTYYIGTLPRYQISGHVYTVDFCMETTATSIRQSAAFVFDGQLMTFTTDKTLNAGTINYNGSTGALIPYRFTRLTEGENYRQYFRYVYDGINMVLHAYAKNTEGAYQLMFSYNIRYENTNAGGFINAIMVGMHNWDAIADPNAISLSDVKIYKGETKSAYQTAYDAAQNGDILFDKLFGDDNDAGLDWSAMSVTEGTVNVSEDGTSIDIPGSGAANRIFAYLQNEWNYGSYTYEFYVSSDMRVGLNVISSANRTDNVYAAGFAFNNTSNSNPNATQFMNGGAFINASGDVTTNATYKLTLTSYVEKLFPDATNADGSVPDVNVKIEMNTLAHTATCYILQDGVFVKGASIKYGNNSNYAMTGVFYPYAYNAGTNAVFKNVVIRKGLTQSGDYSTLLDLSIDGATPKPQLWTASVTLPTIAAKPFYTAEYQLEDGTAVDAMEDLAIVTGTYNAISLRTVYTQVPLNGNVEFRGIQSSLTPDTEAGTTSVRFIGALNSLEYEAVGFLVLATYRDAAGVIHTLEGEIDKSTTTVFGSVRAGIDTTVTAEDLGCRYLYALTINNVPIGEGVQVDFTVAPYTVVDGSTVYGAESVCSFVNGEYDPNATLLE